MEFENELICVMYKNADNERNRGKKVRYQYLMPRKFVNILRRIAATLNFGNTVSDNFFIETGITGEESQKTMFDGEIMDVILDEEAIPLNKQICDKLWQTMAQSSYQEVFKPILNKFNHTLRNGVPTSIRQVDHSIIFTLFNFERENLSKNIRSITFIDRKNPNVIFDNDTTIHILDGCQVVWSDTCIPIYLNPMSFKMV